MNLECKRFWVERISSKQYALMPDVWHHSVLGIISYGDASNNIVEPFIAVNTSELLTGESIYEVWHHNLPLLNGQYLNIRYKYSENLLFGCITMAESMAELTVSATPLQTITETAYKEIFAIQDKLGYNTLLRVWNYFPKINKESYGMERYRQFNIGRQDAFLAYGRAIAGNVPAASVLGTNSDDLNIAFLATRDVMIGIENPRQVSSYFYPSQYGPRTPAFSRATLINVNDNSTLFISGTASIIGHHSVHHGDVALQTKECMNNISAVVAAAKLRVPSIFNIELFNLAYKVYIRYPIDLLLVRNVLDNYLGQPLQAIYLQADICRTDLLVEIEAIGFYP